ncbi:MAG: SDR family oxidoreductase [Caulobacter sp.]
MDLKGQRAVIVGGATGIGAAVCRALVARGASVHVCDLDAEAAARLQAEFPKGVVTTYRCDVTKPETLSAAAAAIRKVGDVQLLFVNAGVASVKPFLQTTPADWQWLLGINLFGTVNTIQAFLPGLLAQEGRARIVVTSSVTAIRFTPTPEVSMYIASKSAQLGLCLALQLELEQTNVDLSVIFPAGVRTSIAEHSEGSRAGAFQPTSGSGGRGEAIDAEVAGERIVKAVEQGRTFISTHPEEADAVRELRDALVGAFTE